MENIHDVFSDLAAFSLANEIISDDKIDTSFSLFNYEYINFIYIGIALLIIIIGVLVYKFNYVKRKVDDAYSRENGQNLNKFA